MKEKKLKIEDFNSMAKNELIEELLQGTIKGGCCEETVFGTKIYYDPAEITEVD